MCRIGLLAIALITHHPAELRCTKDLGQPLGSEICPCQSIAATSASQFKAQAMQIVIGTRKLTAEDASPPAACRTGPWGTGGRGGRIPSPARPLPRWSVRA